MKKKKGKYDKKKYEKVGDHPVFRDPGLDHPIDVPGVRGSGRPDAGPDQGDESVGREVQPQGPALGSDRPAIEEGSGQPPVEEEVRPVGTPALRPGYLSGKIPLEAEGEKPKRLYEVTIEHSLYVIAEDDDEAEREAQHNVNDVSPSFSTAYEITKIEQIDSDWLNERPFGDYEEDVTCKEFLEERMPAPPPYVDPNQQQFDGFPKP